MMKRLRLISLFVVVLYFLAAVSCANIPATSQASELQMGINVFEQRILYDRRGEDHNLIMLHHTFLLINNSEEPVEVELQYRLSASEAQFIDTDSYFGIMMDILPEDVDLPPLDKIVELPPPTTYETNNGESFLQWQAATIDPKSAVLIYFSNHYQDGNEFEKNKLVMTPQILMRSESQKTNDNFQLQYTVENTSNLLIEDIKLSVFVPTQVPSSDGLENNTIYNVKRWGFSPQPADFVDDTGAIDGMLQMSEGAMVQFNMMNLPPQHDQIFTILAEILPTGQSGVISPYLNLVYYQTQEIESNTNLIIGTNDDVKRSYLPTLFICNLGLPDWIKINF